MNDIPVFEAVIVIDEKGHTTIRNCSRDMLEIIFELNPTDPGIQKRIAAIPKSSYKEIILKCLA